MDKKDNKPEVEKAEVELTDDRPVLTPATDIYELKDSIVVKADMPGVSEKDLDVSLEDDVLTMVGKQCGCKPEKHELLHHGYEPGIYKRSFTVLAEVDQDKIKAKIKDGVLEIILPKCEKEKPKKIEIQTG